MAEKKGFFGKLFGGNKDSGFGSNDSEPATRIESRPPEAPREEDEPGKMYLRAKKWREEQAMNEPLVKRKEFKRKY